MCHVRIFKGKSRLIVTDHIKEAAESSVKLIGIQAAAGCWFLRQGLVLGNQQLRNQYSQVQMCKACGWPKHLQAMAKCLLACCALLEQAIG